MVPPFASVRVDVDKLRVYSQLFLNKKLPGADTVCLSEFNMATAEGPARAHGTFTPDSWSL